MDKPPIPQIGDIFRGYPVHNKQSGDYELEHDTCEHDKPIVTLYQHCAWTIVGGECDECFGETSFSFYNEKYDSNDPWYQWLKFSEDDYPEGYPKNLHS